MYPEFHMQSIRSHHRNRALISCWGIQPDQMTPEASRIKAYNLFRGLILRNRIRISFRHFLQQQSPSVPYGPVRLFACVMMRGLAVEREFISGGAGCPGLAPPASSSRSRQTFDVLETQGR